MKKILFNLVVPTAVLIICSFALAHHGKINWRKVETVEEARTVMETLIHPGDDIDVDYMLLTNQKNDYAAQSGDTCIFYHSPYIPVHPLALVAKKFMFTIHYVNKKMEKFEVERALMGP